MAIGKSILRGMNSFDDIGPRLIDLFAGFARDRLGQRFFVFLHQLRDPQQILRPLHQTKRAPVGERPRRCMHGSFNIFCARLGKEADDIVGVRGVSALEPFAGSAVRHVP